MFRDICGGRIGGSDSVEAQLKKLGFVPETPIVSELGVLLLECIEF